MTSQPFSNAPKDQKPHFVLVPLMAQGHMIPTTDLAHLLASRGATVTFITTPLNAIRMKQIIDRTHQSGLPIHFVSLHFPCAEAGLPEGSENIDTLSSLDHYKNFFIATRMLQDPLIHHLRTHSPPPSCIVSGLPLPWTREVARELGVPRLMFNGMGAFPSLCAHNIRKYQIYQRVEDENEPFVVPELPHHVEVTRNQVPGFWALPGIEKLREEMFEAESAADGFVVNSFDDLEPSYKEWLQKAYGKNVWTIGPMSLYDRDAADIAARGNKASIDKDQCLRWLDSMKPNSVLYVSFGSIARPTPSQLIELGLGLEASNCPFIWVIRAGERSAEVEELLASGFEQRTCNRGLIIRGWAPQVMILSHPAVGGFMTHCGWNSTLESVTAGVPMITWPHFADQFLNEKLIVKVMKIGISVGVKFSSKWAAETSQVQVKKTDVERVVRSLMEGGEGEERRKKVAELAKKAHKAVEEGGTSYTNLTHLIQFVNANCCMAGKKIAY